MPEVFGQLDNVRAQLEVHYTDMQDLNLPQGQALYAADAQRQTRRAADGGRDG